LEKELAHFVEQARAKARAKGRTKARTKTDGGVQDKEVEVEAPASPASPALQLRPKRARKVLVRYQG
jgi:hypothetical protein